jgi:hypothetical protein
MKRNSAWKFSPEQASRIRSMIRKARSQPGIVTLSSIPDRDTTDIHGNTFPGLSGNKLAAQAVSSTEVANFAITTTKIDGLAVTTPKLEDLGVITEKLAPLGVTTPKIADLSVITEKIAPEAVTLVKMHPAATNPAQTAGGLRSIGNLLGGDSTQAAAGNHSHGSGNAHDIDLLPTSHQRRILLARQRVRNNIRNLDTLTAAEFRLYVRELSIVAMAALSLEIDSVDLTADERLAKRDAGETLPLFGEWRLQEGQTLHDANHPRYVEGQPDIATIPT